MKQLQLIELIQQHHPKGYTEIRAALNRAQDDFCARTELMKKTYTQSSIAGQRYYELDDNIIKILRIQVNNVDIPRLIGSPIIDDDEFDSSSGTGAAATSSNERYWYVDSGRLGVVEKVTKAVTRDGKSSDYQSISVAKEMRIYSIAQANDFTATLTQESELPKQFHEGLAHKVIADGYLTPPNINADAHKMFYIKYMDMVKEGKKYARSNYNQTGSIRPTYF
mgnify:FL=1|tara:strand:+ start:25 stop:693 length:669 start_codon:yes stop_codon:yes gene_type:complete